MQDVKQSRRDVAMDFIEPHKAIQRETHFPLVFLFTNFVGVDMMVGDEEEMGGENDSQGERYLKPSKMGGDLLAQILLFRFGKLRAGISRL